MPVIEFRLEFGMWGMNAKRMPGASWRATFYDSIDQCHYAGSDDDPWMAIAWALDDRALRRATGRHRLAWDLGEVPRASY